MAVFGHDDKKTIDAVLPMLNCDTPARACAGGCRAVTNEKHMCVSCTQTFSSLTDSSCFNRNGKDLLLLHWIVLMIYVIQEFVYRNLNSQRKWKFIHGTTDDPDVQQHIEDKYGVRMSKFDELAGWFAPLSLPPEVMHLFFGGGEYTKSLNDQITVNRIIGTSHQIHQSIMINGSMFTGSRKRGTKSPMDRLEAFLSSIVWPPSAGRFNSKVFDQISLIFGNSPTEYI